MLRAFLLALVVAGGFATAEVIAQNVCGNPLACFEPGQEGEIWQALTPFGQINDPSCTNSEPTAARVREDSRQCVRADEQPVPQPYTVLMPPSLGQFLDPFALAVDGERIYVSDQSNHRVQVFKFDGTPIKIAHPIGDGVAGSGPYPAYPADSRMTGNNDPITGQRLYSPDGLAVDATGKLVVGDYSGFLNVFNPDGTPAFGTMAVPERLQIVDTVGGIGNLGTKASGIAMSPGTVVQGFHVPPPSGDTSRIVVTDRLNCFVYIYDSGFNLVRQIPEVVPAGAQQGACYWNEEPGATLGLFSSPVAAAIDTQGHIYISDYDNNRIQILDPNGNPLGEFGRELLQYPWGVAVDHKGRVAVADTENQRIAIFTVDYSGASPVASFVFELDAKGTLNGYPTAVVGQVGSGPGLDPAGRFLTTDTLNNRVQRFQLPDLAIINESIDPGGFGSFQVVVPDGKLAPVTFVGVSAVGIGAAVLTINGVAPGNPVSLNPLNTALENATAVLGTTIAPGQVVTYNFTFAPDPGRTDYSFTLNAVGNDGATAAQPEKVDASLPCIDCVSAHEIFVAPGATAPATLSGGWYNTPLTVRINAKTTHVSGLSAIAYQFLSGPESSGQRWGGSIHTLPVTGNTAFIDFGVQSQGVSALRYWAIGGDGTVESSHPLTLSLDLTPPQVVFLFPAANAAGWNNTAVNGSYKVNDGPSGPVFAGTGALSFPNEGRQQFQTVTESDIAGNVALNVASHLSSNSGRYINIDTQAPVIVAPDSITIPANGSGYAVAPGTFVATATDPDLVDARPGANLAGSGVVVLTNPGTTQFPLGTTTFTFSATDAAGNFSSVVRTVTVVQATSTITAPDRTVQYGQPMTVTATLGSSFATGPVTFTFGPSGDYSVAGNVAGGVATASVPSVLLGVGTYTMQVSYAGDQSVSPASTTAQVTVNPAPITVTAQPVTKSVGAVDPPLIYAVTSGALVGSDAFTGALTRAAGELPGLYPILRNTLALSPNYALTYIGANFTIATETIMVFATPSNKMYGDLEPVLPFTYTGTLPSGANFSGALVRDAGEHAGNYRIDQGTLSLPIGFNLVYHSATFTIALRPVTVTAGGGTKVFGTGDPALTGTHNGFLQADNITIAVSRAAGQNAGNYVTTAVASGAALGNYSVSYVPGNFSITPAQVLVTAQPRTITYGDPAPSFGFTYGAFPAGYSAATVATAPVCSVAGPHAVAGSYPITCAGGVIDNNVVFTYAGSTLTVDRKDAHITVEPEARLFGESNPVFGATVTGTVGGDTLDYSLATPAVASSPVAAYPIDAVVGTNPNYNVTATAGQLTINPAPVTITANAKSRIYGAANPPLDGVVVGAVADEPVSYSLATSASVTSGVGSYPIAVTLGANPNYDVLAIDSDLTIIARPITITANTQSMVYGGAEPGLTYSLSTSLVGNDAVTGSLVRAAGSNVGTYGITQGSLALDANYLVAFVGANLTITPRAASVTAGNAQKIVGHADPVLPVSSSGFLASDAVAITASRASGEAIGTYTITPLASGAAVGNYTIIYTTAVFTIVSDNLPPVCGTAYGGEIWPPNHKRFYAAPVRGVFDPEGGAVSIVVTGIWQDEQIDSTGDGMFSPDGNGVGTSTAWVRAERNGHQNKAVGNGRVYEILFTATDNRGAQCTGSVLYGVPHDQGQRPEAIDSGTRYDSTGVVPGARDKWQIHQNSPQP